MPTNIVALNVSSETVRQLSKMTKSRPCMESTKTTIMDVGVF